MHRFQIIIISIFGILISEVNDGLVLISDYDLNISALVDSNQNTVNYWEFNDYDFIKSYLTTDSLLFAFSRSNSNMVMQKFNWEGSNIWTFILDSDICRMHHEQLVLSNGNILALCRETITAEENIYMNIDLNIDKIIEIEPIGSNQANIIWEWHFYDHLIQDFDSNIANYGIISENPQLLDISIHNSYNDFTHLNCIDYNDALNQIIVSSRVLNEVFIIDHSTTTEEAANHIGGIYNNGGDFLYRWGNPINYDRGDLSDQKLHAPHGVNWIKSGLPRSGNILLFDGEHDDSLSAVIEFQPPLLDSGLYMLDTLESFGPNEYIWINQSNFYSNTHSGAFRMPNGNTFITSFIENRIFEVDDEGITQWEYLGDLVTHRAWKYPDIFFDSLSGDINGDEILNILDIVLIINMILSNEYSIVADLNEDGIVDILDVIIVINILIESA